jgi:hypothetical protein
MAVPKAKQELKNITYPFDKNAKLEVPLGIELTMIPQEITGGSNRRESNLLDAYSEICEKLLDFHNVAYRSAHRDSYCIEVTSKVLNTWGELAVFYSSVSEVMLRLGFKPHSENITSGGGHIHVGPLTLEENICIFRDIQNRPELVWVFNDPFDKRSANTFTKDLEDLDPDFIEITGKLNYDPSIFTDGEDSISSKARLALTFFGNTKFCSASTLPREKTKSIRYASGQETLEFRFFDSPFDWDDQRAQVLFVEAYIRYIRKLVAKGGVKTTVYKMVFEKDQITLDEAKTRFISFMIELGLDYHMFDRQIERNLVERFRKSVLRQADDDVDSDED